MKRHTFIKLKKNRLLQNHSFYFTSIITIKKNRAPPIKLITIDTHTSNFVFPNINNSHLISATLDCCGVYDRPGHWPAEDETAAPAGPVAAPPRWGYGPESQLGIVSGEDTYFHHHLGMENPVPPCYTTPVHGYRTHHQTENHGCRTTTHGI